MWCSGSEPVFFWTTRGLAPRSDFIIQQPAIEKEVAREVLVAVQQDGAAMQFAAPELQGEPEFVSKAIGRADQRTAAEVLRYAAPELHADEDLVPGLHRPARSAII